MENKYCYRSRITKAKFRELLRYFSLDLEATKIVKLTGISEPTVIRYLHAIRETLAEECESSAQFLGEVEVDESYFGPRRVRGKRGRGAGKKTPVVGLLKGNGKVYTKIVDKCD